MRFIFLAVIGLAFSCAGNTVKDAALKDGGKTTSSANAPTTTADTPKPLGDAADHGTVSIEAKLAAAQQNTVDVTEVKFEKASRTLGRAYEKKVEEALATAEKKAPLKRITIVVWSDAETPRHHQPALGDADKKLATDRGETIKAYIHQQHAKLSVDIVNMAEKPGRIKKFLRTEDVRIQEVLAAAGEGEPKAARAIVIIELMQKH